jgi:hypothetical protein
VATFYGRQDEIALLSDWLLEQRCRVVSILGMGGMGKSALAVTLMHQAADQFDAVLWRSLRDAPPCEPLLDDLLRVLAGEPLTVALDSLERRLTLLFEYLRTRRVLLVLDNLESVMEEAAGSGRMLPGYEGYGRLLRRAAETKHLSCLLLTSREKPIELAPLEGNRTPVRSLRLGQLDAGACELLLHEMEVTGSAAERARLCERYGGNPLALKIVAPTIAGLFGGEIAAFLEHGELIFGGVRYLLEEQVARLSAHRREHHAVAGDSARAGDRATARQRARPSAARCAGAGGAGHAARPLADRARPDERQLHPPVGGAGLSQQRTSSTQRPARSNADT